MSRRAKRLQDDSLGPGLRCVFDHDSTRYHGCATGPDQRGHDKPLIFSELGAGALVGYHDDPANPHKFSEEFQAEYYRQTLAEASKVAFLRGMSPWILKDFRSPNRQHPIYQQGWNRKGLESETGARKEAFDVLASYYRSLEQHQ